MIARPPRPAAGALLALAAALLLAPASEAARRRRQPARASRTASVREAPAPAPASAAPRRSPIRPPSEEVRPERESAQRPVILMPGEPERTTVQGLTQRGAPDITGGQAEPSWARVEAPPEEAPEPSGEEDSTAAGGARARGAFIFAVLLAVGLVVACLPDIRKASGDGPIPGPK